MAVCLLGRFALACALGDSKRDRKRAVEVGKQALAEYEKRYENGYRYMLRHMGALKAWLRDRHVELP